MHFNKVVQTKRGKANRSVKAACPSPCRHSLDCVHEVTSEGSALFRKSSGKPNSNNPTLVIWKDKQRKQVVTQLASKMTVRDLETD